MAEKNNQDKISWTASEFIDHSRSAGWYFLLALATAAVAAIVYLITHETITTATIFVLGIIVALATRLKPRQVEYEISSRNIKVGSKTYPLSYF
jgi:hypothetical protein